MAWAMAMGRIEPDRWTTNAASRAKATNGADPATEVICSRWPGKRTNHNPAPAKPAMRATSGRTRPRRKATAITAGMARR